VFLNTTSGREPSIICLICCEGIGERRAERRVNGDRKEKVAVHPIVMQQVQRGIKKEEKLRQKKLRRTLIKSGSRYA
jgi:hypothetical protein